MEIVIGVGVGLGEFDGLVVGAPEAGAFVGAELPLADALGVDEAVGCTIGAREDDPPLQAANNVAERTTKEDRFYT